MLIVKWRFSRRLLACWLKLKPGLISEHASIKRDNLNLDIS